MANVVNTIISQEHIDNIVWTTDWNGKIGVKRLIFSPSTLKASSVLVYERPISQDPMFFVDPMFQRIAELAQSDIFGIPDSSVTVGRWKTMISNDSDSSILSDAMDTKVNSMRNKYYTLMTTTEDFDKISSFGEYKIGWTPDGSAYLSVDNPVDWSGHGHWNNMIIPDNFLNSNYDFAQGKCYAFLGDVSTSFAYFGDNNALAVNNQASWPYSANGLHFSSVTCDELTIVCDTSAHLMNDQEGTIEYSCPITHDVSILVNPGGTINFIGFVCDSSGNATPYYGGQFGIAQTMFEKMLAGDYRNNPIHLKFEDSIYELFTTGRWNLPGFFNYYFSANNGFWSDHMLDMYNAIPPSVLVEKLTGNENRYAFQFKDDVSIGDPITSYPVFE